MVTQATYIEYLLSTPRNYTCTHLAEHLPQVSHDQVNRFLRRNSFSPTQLRELVLPLLQDSPEAFLLVDDSVQDKRYSRLIEVAKRQYSGNEHGLVTGICLVNLVHRSGQAGDFLPLDYRVYAPELDGLTKNEHFQHMFAQVVAEDKIQARTLLFDAWYSGSTNLKLIHRAGWTFFTTLKSNRLVSRSKETGYQALADVTPPPGGWSTGLEVRLHKVPFAVRLFKLVASNGDIEWVVTNKFAFAHPTNGRGHDPHALAGGRVSPQLQAADWRREMSVPPCAGPAQPLGLLLSGLGVAAPVCPPHGPDPLSSPPTAMGSVSAPTAG